MVDRTRVPLRTGVGVNTSLVECGRGGGRLAGLISARSPQMPSQAARFIHEVKLDVGGSSRLFSILHLLTHSSHLTLLPPWSPHTDQALARSRHSSARSRPPRRWRPIWTSSSVASKVSPQSKLSHRCQPRTGSTLLCHRQSSHPLHIPPIPSTRQTSSVR